MDINFIEMEQSLRKQLKEDQKQTMNTIQSLCKLCQCSNVSTNPIRITRIFPHWPMELI